MGGLRPVVEGALARGGAVHELVAEEERARLQLRLQRTAGGRAHDAPDPHLLHRPDVGPVVDAVRRQRVLVAVAGHERHLGALDAADADRCRRRPVWRGHRNLGHVVQESVEAGASEDSDHEPGVQIFDFGGSAAGGDWGDCGVSAAPWLSLAYSICTWSSAFWIGPTASCGTSGSICFAASIAFCASTGSFAPSTESFCPARFTSVATVCRTTSSVLICLRASSSCSSVGCWGSFTWLPPRPRRCAG